MKRTILILFVAICSSIGNMAYSQKAVQPQTVAVPSSLYLEGDRNHVQGIVCDIEAGCFYFSFTTRFVKADFQGKVLGSIDKIQGHLGSMTFDPSTRKVYASLECKDDVIGKNLSTFAAGRSKFYIAVIDVDRLDRIGMDSERNSIFRTVSLADVEADYHAKVELDGQTVDHRYSCSGIDGVTIAPKIGKKGGKQYLYCAYGVYRGDLRSDNDYQVIGRYDLAQLDAKASTVVFGEFDQRSIEKPQEKYFVYTGNTEWGVQNLCYDPTTGYMILAVYRGHKPQFPNYSHFTVDVAKKPSKSVLQGVSYDTSRHPILKLADFGLGNSNDAVTGWNFPWGSTGMSALGRGVFVFSQNGRSDAGKQFCKTHLMRWTGDPANPFVEL